MRTLQSFHATALRVKHVTRFFVPVFDGVSATRLPCAIMWRDAEQKMHAAMYIDLAAEISKLAHDMNADTKVLQAEKSR